MPGQESQQNHLDSQCFMVFESSWERGDKINTLKNLLTYTFAICSGGEIQGASENVADGRLDTSLKGEIWAEN